MKKILVLLTIFVGTLVHANEQSNSKEKQLIISIPCTDSTSAIETFRKNGERLYFAGDSIIREATKNQMFGSGIYLWMNIEKGTGSFAIMFPDLTMCLIAPAKDLKPYTGEQPWDPPKGKGS